MYYYKYIQFIIVPSSSPQGCGEDKWLPLLKARAVENQCYIIAANQTGVNYDGCECYGHSTIIDPDGKTLNKLNDLEGVSIVNIDLSKLKSKNRHIFGLKRKLSDSINSSC